MTLWETIKRGVKRMLGIKDIEQALKVKPAISGEMVNSIQLWTQMYEGRAPWLKRPSPGNPERVVSLGLPSFIASERARLATLEMAIEITPPMVDVEEENPDYQPPGLDENGLPIMGSGAMIETKSVPDGDTERADFMNDQLQKQFIPEIRRQLEYACAKGGMVIKPYPVIYESGSTDFAADRDNDDQNQRNSSSNELPKAEFHFDFIHADRFYPMSFDNSGKMTEVCFIQLLTKNEEIYTRLEYHKLEGRQLTVRNYAFVKNNTKDLKTSLGLNPTDNLGDEIPLSEVPEWSNFESEVVIDNVDRLLFGYFRMPEANTIDMYSPLGVSCYSRVIDLIRDADEQYSRLLWEFEGGELAIDVDRDALKIQEYENGLHQTEMPVKQERLFRKVDLNSEETYNVFSPELRDVSLINGLNTILTRIEDAIGLSRGTLSEYEGTESRTATEMRILKQRSYQTNKDVQDALKKAIEDTIYAMDTYCSLYSITKDGEYEVSYEFDDSILVDTNEELEKRITMLNAGLTSKLEIRMWYFGETENQAKAALQRIEDEKKASMETNIMAQAQLGEAGQGKDFSGDNNNPGAEDKNAASSDKT